MIHKKNLDRYHAVNIDVNTRHFYAFAIMQNQSKLKCQLKIKKPIYIKE